MKPHRAISPPIYWREFDAALRSMLGLAVVMGAAIAAALTLTGARSPDAVESVRQPGACLVCSAPVPMNPMRPAPPQDTLKKDPQ